MENIHKNLSTIHEAQYIFSVLNKNITRLYYSVTIILICTEEENEKKYEISNSLSTRKKDRFSIQSERSFMGDFMHKQQ